MQNDFFLYATFVFLIALFLFLFFLWYNGKKVDGRKVSTMKKTPVKKKDRRERGNNSLMEIFDYHGIKIIQEHGKYTIRDKDFTRSYPNIESLPPKYKKMLLQLTQNAVPKNTFKMDYDGKLFRVIDSKGKIKKYKKFLSIPEHIRQKLPKPGVEDIEN